MHSIVHFRGNVDFEYLILGAGPAGLQMGHHLSRAGHSYLILEAGDSPGHFFKTFPRHRILISSNKVYTGSEDPEVNLRFDWNSLLSEGDGRLLFRDYSHQYFPPADEMVRYLGDYADFHELNVRCNTRILRVEKPRPNQFRLHDDAGAVYTCRRLIVATGTGKPYIPTIPGIELAESYVDVSVSPEDFANQRVLILGKGDSAFETADNLVATTALLHVASPNPLRRAVSNNFLDSHRIKAQNAVLDCTVDRIEHRDGQYVVSVRYSPRGEAGELTYDRVIVCTGFRFDASIFAADCRPELVINHRFPAQTCDWESVNVPGLYFAGTLMQANVSGQHASAFIHGFRYNVRALFRMLEKKHHRREWPAREIEPTPEGLVEATLVRLNRTSALWHQTGFLHDVIVVDEGWDRAVFYEEMPLAYVLNSPIGDSRHYYTLTLETESGLHPVIRRWCGRRLISEQRLPEDLFGEWTKEDAHVAPLRFFFMEQLLEAAELVDLEMEELEAVPERRGLRSVAM